MRREHSSRACKVLYNVIKSNNIQGTVLMPSNICESVPATYLKCGMQIQFCDINKADWQIDRNAVLDILCNSLIRVLHYNHTYGYQCDDDNEFIKLIRDKYPDLLIIDDRCLCFPETVMDYTPADVVLYSTGNVKCVDLDWGGFAFISDRLEYRSFDIYYSRKDEELFAEHIKFKHRYYGPVNNSIIISNWLCDDSPNDNYFELIEKKKAEIVKHKRIINSIYREIPGSMDLNYCDWRYQVLLNNSRECIDLLFSNNLFCSCHYLSLGNGYFSTIRTPNCNWLENHIINLFNDYRYTEEQALKTVTILKRFAIPAKM